MTNKLTLLLETILGKGVWIFLEKLRGALHRLLFLLSIPRNRIDFLIVMLVRKIFGDRIQIRVSVREVRFNVRWPSQDFAIIREVLVRQCYSLKRSFEPKPGSVILDLGAYIGDYTLYAAMKGATVVAVEPSSSNVKMLLKNIELNNVSDRVKVIKAAVSNFRGYVDFPKESFTIETGGYSLNYDKWSTDTLWERVPVLTLDDIIKLAGISRVDVIKVDIEGEEDKLLEGAVDTILRFKPRFVFEVHSLNKLIKLVRKFKELGYKITVIRAGPFSYTTYLYAEFNSRQ